MIVLPAIDLRGGAAVQLVGGDYDAERFRAPDPLAQAAHFRDAGFGALHVVDLDAATGRGDNAETIARLLAVPGLSFSVGGGVRTLERASELIALGASAVVVGTRAVTEPAFLRALTELHPGRITLALDVRGREVLTKGWALGSGQDVGELLAGVRELSLHAVLVTAVHVEGTETGPDFDLYRELRAADGPAVIASGGIGSMAHLRDLAALEVSSAVVGMALYSGALDALAVAREFGR